MVAKHGHGYKIDENSGFYPVILWKVCDGVTREIYRNGYDVYFESEEAAVDYAAGRSDKSRLVIEKIECLRYMGSNK